MWIISKARWQRVRVPQGKKLTFTGSMVRDTINKTKRSLLYIYFLNNGSKSCASDLKITINLFSFKSLFEFIYCLISD